MKDQQTNDNSESQRPTVNDSDAVAKFRMNELADSQFTPIIHQFFETFERFQNYCQ